MLKTRIKQKNNKEIRNFCKDETIEDCKKSIKYCLNSLKTDSLNLDTRYNIA